MLRLVLLFVFFIFPTHNYASSLSIEEVQNNISSQSPSANIGDYCNDPDIYLNDDHDEKTREEIIREMDNSFFMALNQFEECNVERSNNFGQNEGIDSGQGSLSGYGSGQSNGSGSGSGQSNGSSSGSGQSSGSGSGSGQSNGSPSVCGKGGCCTANNGYCEERGIDGTIVDVGGEKLWDLNEKDEGVLKKQLLESCEVFEGNEKTECIKEMETLY